MIIKRLRSRRDNEGQCYALPIIYEWEDVIADKMSLSIISLSFVEKVVRRLRLPAKLSRPLFNTFRFVYNGRQSDEPMNGKHVVPCIIDFFEKEDQLPEFYAKHSNNKIVFLSSPFDYEYLKKNNCPLNLGLFAYSLPDKYMSKYFSVKKEYDIVLTGRQDPVLYSFFVRYIKSHPGVSYVKRGQNIDNDEGKTKSYYLNGETLISDLETREDFMHLQAKGRVTLYGTQGYDQGNFYHMTPHFLEIIACSSHVLLHYPTDEMGVDARYYEFSKFSPSIETYDEFESSMDKALNTDVDKNMYEAYLKRHITSARIPEFIEQLKTV